MVYYDERTITMNKGVIVNDTSEIRSGSLLDTLDDETYHGDYCESTCDINPTLYASKEYKSDSY